VRRLILPRYKNVYVLMNLSESIVNRVSAKVVPGWVTS
jgi:hypothetical protein